MSRNIFGWSYPPGCSGPPDQDDGPCEVCGQPVDGCICPECPRCTSYGDPQCYAEPDLGVCAGLHEVGKTLEQQIGKQKLEIYWTKERLREEEDHLADLEKRKKCQDHAAKFGITCPGPDYYCCYDEVDKPCLKGCPA